MTDKCSHNNFALYDDNKSFTLESRSLECKAFLCMLSVSVRKRAIIHCVNAEPAFIHAMRMPLNLLNVPRT